MEGTGGGQGGIHRREKEKSLSSCWLLHVNLARVVPPSGATEPWVCRVSPCGMEATGKHRSLLRSPVPEAFVVVVESLSCVQFPLHGLQHPRLPCPSLSPRVCSNSCPLSQQCHRTISSSVTPFSSCLQSFPASGSFPMTQLFTSGGQTIGASVSVSALLMNIQD